MSCEQETAGKSIPLFIRCCRQKSNVVLACCGLDPLLNPIEIDPVFCFDPLLIVVVNDLATLFKPIAQSLQLIATSRTPVITGIGREADVISPVRVKSAPTPGYCAILCL